MENYSVINVNGRVSNLIYDCRAQNGFSLLELVCVVILITALTYVALSASFPGVTQQADAAVLKAEMSSISRSFQQVYDDVVLTDSQLTEVKKFGLWPLFQRGHPTDNTKDLEVYDDKKGRGWRGAYMGAEFRNLKIDSTSTGQAEDVAGDAIPGIYDPYGGYYRVLMPDAGDYKEKRLALVCTGKNKILDTTDTADANNYVAAAGDDTVVLLIPLAP